MSDYASLKVPDLKKLLSERGLPQSGNKADLIARLQENDKTQAEDVIDWDDDDTKIAAVTTKKDDPTPAAAPTPVANETPAAPAPAPAKAEPAAPAAPPATEATEVSKTTDATPTQASAEEGDATAATTEKPAEPSSFAQGLAASEAEKELKKREDRAKRFGITADERSDEAKKADRAQRFGIDKTEVVKGLDEALPEHRPKRGRERGDDGQRGSKRQNVDNRNGGRDRQNNNRQRGGRRGGGDRGGERRGGGGQKANILTDPEEKAKAERRAKRFGGDN